MITRRAFLLALPVAALSPTLARAQESTAGYPIKPVRILVGFPKGGPVDIAARTISPWLSERLKQPFEVTNVVGQSGNVATREALRAAPDGYTLLLCGPVNAINTSLFKDLDFNFTSDAAPVASISSVPLAIEVTPSFKVRSVPEFLNYARAHPGEIKVAYAGKGTPQHIGIELFKKMAGVDLTLVPYPGSKPALQDLLAGKAHMMFDPISSSMPLIKDGKLWPLAVTSPQRLESLPQVPSMAEFVSGYEAGSWFGLVGPKGLPDAVVEKLNLTVNAGLHDQRILDMLAGAGAKPLPASSAAFGNFIRHETEKYRKVIVEAKISA